VIAAARRRLMAPAPPERLALLRLATGAFAVIFLLARAPALVRFDHFRPEQFVPAGPVALLAAPLPAWVPYLLLALALPLGAAFVAGLRFAVTGPLFAGLFVWITSYRCSWGMLFHTENLLCLHLCVIAVARSADALSLDARGKPPPDGSAQGWPVRVLCLVTTAAYLVAGIAKLQSGGLAWALGDELRRQIAWDALRKHVVGSVHSPLGALLLRHPWLFPPVATVTLAAEVLGPLTLLHRRAAHVWCAIVWGFHVGVLALMVIVFPYPLSGVAFAPFFRLERVLPWLQRLRGGEHPQHPAAVAQGGPGVLHVVDADLGGDR
jgi:hypothetical protein